MDADGWIVDGWMMDGRWMVDTGWMERWMDDGGMGGEWQILDAWYWMGG